MSHPFISSTLRKIFIRLKESSIRVALSYPLILSAPLSLQIRAILSDPIIGFAILTLLSYYRLRYPLSAPTIPSSLLVPPIISSAAILSAPII